MKARPFHVAALLALVCALLVGPGCATLGKVLGKVPEWCSQEQTTFAWAAAPGGPFDTLTALSLTNPAVGDAWLPIKKEIGAAQAALDRACAEPGPTSGSIGGVVATAVTLLSDALGLFGSLSGARELRDGERWLKERAKCDALALEVERTTGARPIVGSRNFGGR